MDEINTVPSLDAAPVPDELRSLFNSPDQVRVQTLPGALPDVEAIVVYFGPGARTVPHRHHRGQHLVIVDGVGVIGDEKGVHVVRTGDVVSTPPGAWHWHGATPGNAVTHVVFAAPRDVDLDVERRDWDDTYGPELNS